MSTPIERWEITGSDVGIRKHSHGEWVDSDDHDAAMAEAVAAAYQQGQEDMRARAAAHIDYYPEHACAGPLTSLAIVADAIRDLPLNDTPPGVEP